MHTITAYVRINICKYIYIYIYIYIDINIDRHTYGQASGVPGPPPLPSPQWYGPVRAVGAAADTRAQALRKP